MVNAVSQIPRRWVVVLKGRAKSDIKCTVTLTRAKNLEASGADLAMSDVRGGVRP